MHLSLLRQRIVFHFRQIYQFLLDFRNSYISLKKSGRRVYHSYRCWRVKASQTRTNISFYPHTCGSVLLNLNYASGIMLGYYSSYCPQRVFISLTYMLDGIIYHLKEMLNTLRLCLRLRFVNYLLK